MMLQSKLPFMPPSSWEETHDKDISCLELALPSHDFVAPAAESYSFGAGGGGDCNNVKMISVAWDSVHGSSSCLGHGFVDKTDDDMSVVNEDISLNSGAHRTEYIAAGADHGDQFNDHYASLGSDDESTWPPPKDALTNSRAHYNSHDRRPMSVALNLSREYPVEAAAIRETTTTSIPSASKCLSPKDLHRWPPKIAAKNAKAKDSSCHEDHQALNYGVLTGSRNTPKVCVDCNTTKTPLWRSGPHGPKSLCNACGIRYRKARRALSAFGSADHIAAYKSRMSKRKHQQQQVDQDEEYKFVHYKKRSRMSIPSRKSIKNSNFKFTAKVNPRSFQRVFAEDEKEAAVLLMALSCGQLVNR